MYEDCDDWTQVYPIWGREGRNCGRRTGCQDGQNGKLNAVVYSFFGYGSCTVWGYDIIHYHYHAEGACAMLWIPHSFGIGTIATIHGLDRQRSKWGTFASRFLLFGKGWQQNVQMN